MKEQGTVIKRSFDQMSMAEADEVMRYNNTLE